MFTRLASVISTLQPRTCQGASETQGFALSVCEERKAASGRAIAVSFVSLAFESLGGCSNLTAETLAGIGRAVGQRLGIPPATASRQLFQRCSVFLRRGNATLWLHRFSIASPFGYCNPRRACAARVTVVVLCVSVCRPRIRYSRNYKTK